ncbi:MAG: septum formation initiator family protein [Clostridia bacterium]|nr:septum formation initiator family protein [Clostridia bacterium]MBR6620523.1 septum formation initiator family protein [Clostridia bacterium]
MNSKNKGRISIVLVLALVALIGYFIINSIQLRMDIKDKTEQVSELSEQISEQDKANAELEEILDSENESEYLEQYAREELDYVMPGERVYANSAS